MVHIVSYVVTTSFRRISIKHPNFQYPLHLLVVLPQLLVIVYQYHYLWSMWILMATRLFHLDPTIISFSFSGSLILARFTIFHSFLGAELPESLTSVGNSKSTVVKYIFLIRYFSHQTKIVFQSYVPRNLMYQFTQTGLVVLVLHLLGLGF